MTQRDDMHAMIEQAIVNQEYLNRRHEGISEALMAFLAWVEEYGSTVPALPLDAQVALAEVVRQAIAAMTGTVEDHGERVD